MRGNDRRRSPPRRDDRRFGGGGPPPPGWDRRRPRSASPPDRFRRSPPGKRFRRDDYDDDRYPGSAGRFDRGEGYGRRGGRFDDRYDDRGPPPPRMPLTFVEFVRDLPPHVGPEQANDEYRRYMADWWGDAIKAEFEERKGDPLLRRRFDPREILRIVEQRNELAAAAARGFTEQLEAGSLNAEEQSAPGPEGFTDPAAAAAGGRGGEEEEAAVPPPAPTLCWQPVQLAADLALAKQLMQTVDKEKGIADNPLLPAAAAAAAAAAGEGGEAAEAEVAAGGDEQQPAAAEGEEQQQKEEPKEGGGTADMDAELSPEEQQAKLDQVLLYLWRVHGIDFYGGREYNNPSERGRGAARRTLRGPQPSDAELTAAAAEAEAAAAADAAAAGDKEGTEPATTAAGEGAAAQAGKQQEEQEAGGGGEAAPAGEAGEGAVTAAAAADGGEESAATAPADSDAAGAAAAATSPAGPAKDAAAEGDQQQKQQQGSAGSGKDLQRQQQGSEKEGGSSEEAREYRHRVTGFWEFRIEKGDPLERPLQRKRIDEEIERFVDSQILKIEDNKWGNKLSNKLFMGREFVVKHIRNKHSHVVEAERERIQDEVFWENFRAFKQEEQRRQEEEQERIMAGMAAGGGFGGDRGRGRGGGGMMPLEPAAMPMNPGMMMAPIIMPTAGGMAPVILPMEMVMGMAGGMGGRVGGGRGGPGMRGPGGRGGMGGRGPRGGPGMGGPVLPGAKLEAGVGVREYFDLDAPQNNRAVLDYGDL